MMRFAFAIVVLWLVACDQVFGLPDRPKDGATSIDSTMEDGLVARFTLDDNDEIRDTTGMFVGVCQPRCPTTTDGRVGGALHFDGATSVGVNSKPGLETAIAFTITGWYRLDPPGTAVMCPFNKMYGQDENSWQLCFTNRTVQFLTTDPDGNLLQGEQVVANTWLHIALVWDGSQRSIVVNGFGGATNVGTTLFDGSPLGIGADYDNGVPHVWFQGDIDDVRIYNRALSLDEIIAMINSAS